MLDKTLAAFREAGAEIVDLKDILTTAKINSLTSGIDTNTFEYDLNKYLYEKGDAAEYKTVKAMDDVISYGTMHMYLVKLTADY